MSTLLVSVDDGCGYPVDNGDKIGNIREIEGFVAVKTVDNPVDTVDENAFGGRSGLFTTVNNSCIKQNDVGKGRCVLHA